MPEIAQMISTVGFPIVVSLLLMLYIKDQAKDHKEETRQFTEALNNNTLALESLKDKLDEVIK